jgi:predicted ATPase
MSRLIGRQDDIARIEHCLAQGRLVTLTEVGGVGKSRLAVAVAERARNDYSGGASFVALAAVSPDESMRSSPPACTWCRATGGRCARS